MAHDLVSASPVFQACLNEVLSDILNENENTESSPSVNEHVTHVFQVLACL